MAESNFPPNQLRATFNNNSGDLFVDWLGANPQQNGIGTEMLSRAVEQLGPENVKSISGMLDDVNESNYNRDELGLSSLDAAARTPAGEIRQTIGFGSNLQVGPNGALVGYRNF